MPPRCSGIYKIVHAESGRLYIGSAVDFQQRWHSHVGALGRGTHKNAHLQSAWLKYGRAAFSMTPLLFCAASDLVFYEQLCLDAYDAVARGFNKSPTAGNCLGIVRTPDYIAKVAAAKRGVPMTPAAKAAHALAMASAETRGRISASKKGRTKAPVSDAHRAALSASQRGRIVSLVARAKLSAANLGKKNGPHSEETRRKISAAQKGRPLSAAHCAALSLGQQRRFERERLDAELRST
jgi:group I intron endonuclease